MPVIEVQWDPQERVLEPTAEQALLSRRSLSVLVKLGLQGLRLRSTGPRQLLVLSPQQSCFEARPQGLEVLEFVFRDRIQQRAFEQLKVVDVLAVGEVKLVPLEPSATAV